MIIEQPSDDLLVVGFVNIHTHQAEEMLEYFEHEADPWTEDVEPAVAGLDTERPELPRRAPRTKPATLPRRSDAAPASEDRDFDVDSAVVGTSSPASMPIKTLPRRRTADAELALSGSPDT